MKGANERQTTGARNGRARNLSEYLSLGQGAFYPAIGVWQLLSMRAFERVTGPKTDKWLVKTAAGAKSEPDYSAHCAPGAARDLENILCGE
ncbi:MAG TPA: hypothetical protein VIM99_02215 [Blastocatellia bacterium]